jgi:hypothetical protein
LDSSGWDIIMAHRKIQDATGRWWDVWETRPTIIDRRDGRDRRSGPREAEDRRQLVEARVVVGPEYRDGWLAFQSGAEWRRLAPIPPQWEQCSNEELAQYLESAARHQSARSL